MPIFVGHDSARTLAAVMSNNNHTRMVHGDPFAIYTKAASGYVGFAPGIRCSALSDLGELGRGVGNLQGLQHLQLDFRLCSALPSTLARKFETKDAVLVFIPS